MIYPLNEGEQQRELGESLFSVAERRRLGQLSDLAMQFALLQGTAHPELRSPQLLMLASSHGFVQLRSAEVAEHSALCVRDFATGKHFVNALCRRHGFALRVVDAGLATPMAAVLGVSAFAPRQGTRDFFVESAMQPEEFRWVELRGRQLVNEAVDTGSNVLALGCTASGGRVSAALLAERMLGIGLDVLMPEGAGYTTFSLVSRAECQKLLDTTPRGADWREEVLRFGGFELVMAMGVMLQAAERKVAVMIDSFTMLVALMLATCVDPHVKDYVVLAHMESMQGMELLAKRIGIEPVLRLGLQTTEGVGCLTTFPVLEAAVLLLSLPKGEVGR